MATVDTAKAQALLRRNRTATARERAQTSTHRGPVLEFEGGRELTTGYKNKPARPQSPQVADDELLNRPRSAAHEALLAQERAAKERENSRRWMEQRTSARNANLAYQRPSEVVQGLKDAGQSTPELEDQYRQFEAAQAQARQSTGGVATQLQRARNVELKAQALQQQINRIHKTVERAKDAKDFLWTLYAAGSTAEAEGAAVETVHGSGILVSLYRVIKTVIMPSAAFSKDPNAGQFFKGPLGLIEPTVLKPTKITAWIAGLHGIYGIIVTGFLFLVIFLAIIIVGVITALGVGVGNMIGGMIVG